MLKMREIVTLEEFETLIDSEDMVILDVYATWCGPCKAIAPVFAELADTYDSATFVKCNCSTSQEVAHKLGITSLPTFVVFSNGERVDSIVCGNAAKLREFVKRYVD